MPDHAWSSLPSAVISFMTTPILAPRKPGMERDRHDISSLHRAARPPSIPDVRRRAELEQQLGRRAAARRDPELDVRVGPHVFGDRRLDRRLLAHVIDRRRSMMRERGGRDEQAAAIPATAIPTPKQAYAYITSLRALRCRPFEVERDQQVLVRHDAAVHRRDPLRIQLQLVDPLNQLRGVVGPALRRADLVAGRRVVARRRTSGSAPSADTRSAVPSDVRWPAR